MKMRPLVRYHGSKYRIAPWIISHFPKHRIYVEPFGGGGSVLLRKPRAYAEIYNDLCGEMVNLFKVARDRGNELRTALELTPFARDEFDLSYEPAADELEQARRTIVRSFMGFGSASASGYQTGFRPKSNNSGTTPARDWANYPKAFHILQERLQGVVIENRDAADVMLQQDSVETLHYVDPPYVAETRDGGADYRFEMSNDDHERLSDVLHSLKGHVIVSGYRCDLYDGLYADWHRVEREALADGARPRVECLWMPYRTADANQGRFLFGQTGDSQ